MTQLPLFPREAEELLAAIRRERLYEGASARLKTAPDPLPSPHDPLLEAWEALPAGVLDFPTPPVGDPAYEAFGLIVVDAPRGVAKGLRARHRWARDR